MDVAIGLDLGGTDLKWALVDARGRCRAEGSVPTVADQGRRGLVACFGTATRAAADCANKKRLRVVATGLGLPGGVQGARGLVTVVPPQIPGIRGLAVAALLSKLTGVPAVAENDATVAALAEARCGAGRGKQSVLMLTVGTGLGGGLVINGRTVRGIHGTGGEIGHALFKPGGIPCRHDGLAGQGCLELYTSASALRRIHGELGGEAELSPREIVQRARRGDATARAALAQIGTNLGLGVSGAAALVDPEVIIVGGGLSAAGNLLLAPMRKAFRLQTIRPLIRGTPIVRAKLGNTAGSVGAALLALEELALKSQRASRASNKSRKVPSV
jgi:glucokinase